MSEAAKIIRFSAEYASRLEPLVLALFRDSDPRDEVERYINEPDNRVVFIAEREGRLVGFIEVGTRPYAEGCLTSPVGYIEAWYVHEDVRRQGIGRLLFGAAENWAREQGLSEIASDALIDNEVSIAAHKALGYTEVERIVCFMKRL